MEPRAAGCYSPIKRGFQWQINTMEQAATPYGLEQWVDFLKPKPLPVLAKTVQLLKYLLQDPNLSLHQLVPVVRHDPVFLMHMVQLANQLNKNKDTEANTAELAVATLGMDRIEKLCNELPVIKINHASVPHKRYFHAISNSYHAAVQAANLCRYPNESVINDTRMAALFYGIGYWALWRYAPQQSCDIKIRIYEHEEDVVLAEHNVLGCTVQQISEALAAAWGISSLALQALKHSTSPDAEMLDRLHRYAEGGDEFEENEKRDIMQLLNAPFYPVKLANWLSLTVPYGWERPKAVRLLEVISDYLNQPLDDVSIRLHKNCVRASREHHIEGILPPAAALLLLPSDLVLNYRMDTQKSAGNKIGGTSSLSIMKAERLTKIKQQEKLLQAQKAAKLAAQEEEIQEPAEQFKDKVLFSKLSQRFIREPGHYSNDMAVYTDLIKGLKNGLGLERLNLLEVTGELRLNPIAQTGFDKESPMRRFNLSLQLPGLFKKLTYKSMAVRAGDHNREQIWSEIPERFKRACNQRSFVLMSLFKNQQPVAYLYADLGHEDETLSDFQFKYFKYLCGAANRCLNTYADHQPLQQDD